MLFSKRGKILKKNIIKMLGTLAVCAVIFGTLACSAETSDDNNTVTVSSDKKPSEKDSSGTVSIAASVSKVTVTFKDAEYEGKKKDVVITLVSGQNGGTAQIPSWTRDSDIEHYELVGWQSSVQGVSTTSSLKQDVTFTAVWRKYYKVTFVDSVAGEGDEAIAKEDDVIVRVYDDLTSKTVELPEFASKADDYNLTWVSSVEGVTVNSEITEDVTFTASWAEKAKFTVKFVDTVATNENDKIADVEQTVYEGKKATVPNWKKTNYTLSWNPDPNVAISAETTFTAKWTELPKCANCGTHYETEAEAEACAVKSGCPKFVAVTEGTYSLVKDAGLFVKQGAGASQTANGITVTCTIDSNGANLKSSVDGYVKFSIESSMILTFADSTTNGAAVYKVADDGTESENAETNSETAPKYKYTLVAGTYKIKGVKSSSAKITELKFEAAEFTSKNVKITNDESTLGLVATSVTSDKTDIATAELDSEGIKIKSVAAGTATVTCMDSSSNMATIAVTVSASGAITTKVTKYSAGGSTGSGAIICSFTSSGASDASFTVAGSIQTDKGKYKVGSNEYEKCVKLDSKGSVKFTTTKEMTMTLYMKVKKTTEIQVSVDGVKKTLTGGSAAASTSNAATEMYVYTATLAAGEHIIAKGAGETYLFAIELSE